MKGCVTLAWFSVVPQPLEMLGCETDGVGCSCLRLSLHQYSHANLKEMTNADMVQYYYIKVSHIPPRFNVAALLSKCLLCCMYLN